MNIPILGIGSIEIPMTWKSAFGKKVLSVKDNAGIEDPYKNDTTISTDIQDPNLRQTYAAQSRYEEAAKDRDRFNVAKECWNIYFTDSRVTAGIDGIADDATCSDNEGDPYKIHLDIEGDVPKRIKKEHQRIINLNKRLSLYAKVPQLIKRAMNEGASYWEIVIDKKEETIVDLIEVEGILEGFLMKEMIDPKTKQVKAYILYNKSTGKPVRTYEKWQIQAFHWNKFGYYGRPLMGSSINDCERIKDQEISMHQARINRAYVRFGHVYEGATMTQLKDLRDLYEAERRTRGQGTQSDIFTNKDIKMFDPKNDQLANIEDVRYLEKKILTGVRRPKGFFGGFGEDVNRSVLEKQEEAYIRFLTKVDAMVGEGLKNIFELQLILDGFLPEEMPLSVLWTDKNVDNFLSVVSALAIAREQGGLSSRTFLEELGFDPDLELARNKREETNPIRKMPEPPQTKQNLNATQANGSQKNKDGIPNNKQKPESQSFSNRIANLLLSKLIQDRDLGDNKPELNGFDS